VNPALLLLRDLLALGSWVMTTRMEARGEEEAVFEEALVIVRVGVEKG